MRYPINEELMVKIYKENLSSDGSEFNENDEEYIRTLTKLVNNAYNEGVKVGKTMTA